MTDFSAPFIWAPPGTLYPAGSNPWNSQLVALPPAGQFFSPEVPIDAEEVNYCLTQISGNLQFLMGQRGASWNPPQLAATFTSYGSSSILTARWFPVSRRWMAVATTGGSPDNAAVYASYDGNDAWTTWGTSTIAEASANTIAAICEDPIDSTKFWLANVITTGTVVKLRKYNGSGYTVPATGGGTFPVVTDVQLLGFNGYVIFAIAEGLSNLPLIQYSNTNYATSSSFTLSINVAAWALKASPTLVLLAPTKTPMSTPQMLSTVDGHTWVNTGLGSILSTTDQILDLDYGQDAGGACWLMTVGTAAGLTKIFRSPDGFTWSLVNTISSPNSFDACLAAVGGLWYTVVTANVAGVYTLASSANGGLNWQGLNAAVTPLASPGTVVGSPNQAICYSTTQIRTSVVTGVGPAIT